MVVIGGNDLQGFCGVHGTDGLVQILADDVAGEAVLLTVCDDRQILDPCAILQHAGAEDAQPGGHQIDDSAILLGIGYHQMLVNFIIDTHNDFSFVFLFLNTVYQQCSPIKRTVIALLANFSFEGTCIIHIESPKRNRFGLIFFTV